MNSGLFTFKKRQLRGSGVKCGSIVVTLKKKISFLGGGRKAST